MSRKTVLAVAVVLVGLMLLPAIVPRAPAIEGIPFARESISVSNTPTGITNTLCRQGGVASGTETKALLQVQSNGIYYYLDTGASYPLATNGALLGNVGDIIEIVFPSKFSVIRSGSGNASVSVTCFQ